MKLMAESGIFTRIERTYALPDICSEVKREKTNVHALSIYEVAAAFIVLLAGLATSLLVILLELMVR